MTGLPLLFGSVVLLMSMAAHPQEPPTLLINGCQEASAAPESRICVPIALASSGAPVGSIGFTLVYDSRSLSSLDVFSDLDQDVLFTVEEGADTNIGRLRVTVTPPVSIPIPTTPDGVFVEACFAVTNSAAEGCSHLSFQSVDFGSTEGRDIPAPLPNPGGICVGSEPCDVGWDGPNSN